MSRGFATLPIIQQIIAPLRALARSGAASRRLRAALAALTLVVGGTTSLQNATANGDTRTLEIQNMHTGERGVFTFRKDGRYDEAVLKKLNWMLRDWRKDEPTDMDPELFDLVWEVYREVGAKEPIHVVSGYRSPSTNSMLRSRSKAVAQQSQHTRGRAMDFYIPGVSITELRVAGLRMQRGGVGFYPTSGSPFVHMDTGSVRHWPRMTHDQLVKVFPDEKTIHVPSNGKPLANYEAALAELESGRRNTAVASADPGKGIRQFFASLFGKSVDQEEDEAVADETPAPKVAPAPKAVQVAAVAETPAEAPRAAPVRVVAAPLPTSRPAEIAAAIVAAQAVVAPLPRAPLPLRRPATQLTATQAPATQVASATVPPLPAVITRGSKVMPDGILAYAPSGDLDPQRPLTHDMIAAPAIQARQRIRTAEIPFGRLFLGPSLAQETYLRLPELRVFASFMTAPREIVAAGFSDAGPGLSTTRFSGPALAALPVYTFGTPAVRLTQRLP
ncbi:DUF882 domain-containing protein [Aquabacter spiritensis]|uniref:Murein endopeptidase K n=1 Tax=Aquabacter spiritensis TaxID=933073 RepID=A0A4R3M0C4_9HYPH|nr:DUF882 domain-containing protein [Aquabacter spiritensis]TCT05609.1 uncharacterized protein YcbK (DUF882 family) [Aquabacter spiritensis]